MKEPIHFKSSFERFLDEYTAIEVPADNKRGFKVEYVYYGTWYVWDLPVESLKKKKRIIALNCFAGVMATVIAACFHNWINTMRYVAIPAVLGMLVCFLQTICTGRFFFSKNPTSRSNYRAISNGLKVLPILGCGLSLFTIIACIGYLFFLRVFDSQSFIIILLHLVIAVTSISIRKAYCSIGIRTEKNTVLSKVKPLSPNSLNITDGISDQEDQHENN